MEDTREDAGDAALDDAGIAGEEARRVQERELRRALGDADRLFGRRCPAALREYRCDVAFLASFTATSRRR
jgi:hypothetical protein